MNLMLFKIANFMMSLSQLAVEDNPATQYYNEATGKFTGPYAFLDPIIQALNAVLVPVLILVATAGTIYAVILGVNMAKAESAEKREEAKKRIINAVLALVIIIVLILLLNLFKNNIHIWLFPTNA